MRQKKILILCEDDLRSAPRFQLEVDALHQKYSLLAAGFSRPSDEKLEFIDLSVFSAEQERKYNFHFNYPWILKKIISFYIRYLVQKGYNKNAYFKARYWTKIRKAEYDHLLPYTCDLIIVHHLTWLPLAVELGEKKGIPVVFNAHEYYPGEFDNNSGWLRDIMPFYKEILDRYLERVKLMLNVSPEIDKKYKTDYRVDSLIIPNVKKHYPLSPGSVAANEIKIIHHGAAIPDRFIEKSIEIMDFLPARYTLYFMLTGASMAYLQQLKKSTEKRDNIIFLDPVAMEEIPSYINQFDIGLFLLPPVNFNYTYALPNKFFEFIQARLCIAIGPSVEMKYYVEKYDLGVIADSFEPEDMARKIRELSPDKILHYKRQNDLYSYELSSQATEKLLAQRIDQLMHS